jgi:hypothetical protein
VHALVDGFGLRRGGGADYSRLKEIKGKARIATLPIMTSYAPSWVLSIGVISNEALFILVDGSGMRGGCLGGWMDSRTLEEMKFKRTSATLQI